MNGQTHRRILAIDPTSRGFGFVVLEGKDRLVDWGLKSIRENKDEATLVAVADLVHMYAPHVLVLEDCADGSSRRGHRVRDLIGDIAALGVAEGLITELVSISAVRMVFTADGAETKHEIAGVIAAGFPELVLHRPRFRKPWMSEDERQAIFDAISFTMTALGHS